MELISKGFFLKVFNTLRLDLWHIKYIDSLQWECVWAIEWHYDFLLVFIRIYSIYFLKYIFFVKCSNSKSELHFFPFFFLFIPFFFFKSRPANQEMDNVKQTKYKILSYSIIKYWNIWFEIISFWIFKYRIQNKTRNKIKLISLEIRRLSKVVW